MLAFVKVLQPKTLEEAYQLFIKHKTAPLLAGGCWLRLGKRRWPLVIDMSQLGLDYIRLDEKEREICIGAMATQGDVERDTSLQSVAHGLLPKAVHEILGVQFRNMATIGGSVASRFGFSDIIPLLLALRADVVLYHGGRMSLESYMTWKERDILVEVRISCDPPAVAIDTLRNSRGDFPYLTGAIRYDTEGYALYIGARPGAPGKAVEASNLLNAIGPQMACKAGELAANELTYQSNSHASSAYRQAMVVGMVRRLVSEVDKWKSR